MNMISFNILPTEIIYYISDYLNIKEWINLKLLSHKYHYIFDDTEMIKKYKEYCSNKYTKYIIDGICYYQVSKNRSVVYCNDCSKPIAMNKIRFHRRIGGKKTECYKNKQLLICEFNNIHITKKCNCPYSIVNCYYCNKNIFNSQYIYHKNICKDKDIYINIINNA
jgi:hypothetical protein